MGTYAKVILKDTSDVNIKSINSELEKLGFNTKYNHGIQYGAFTTKEQLLEDVRYMNEDPEGLKQCPNIKRPITYEWFEDVFWNKLGSFVWKLSASPDEDILQILIVAQWAYKNQNKVNQKESDYYDIGFVKSYLEDKSLLGNNEIEFDFGFD